MSPARRARSRFLWWSAGLAVVVATGTGVVLHTDGSPSAESAAGSTASPSSSPSSSPSAQWTDTPAPTGPSSPPPPGAVPAASSSARSRTTSAAPVTVATDAPSTTTGGPIDVVLTRAAFDAASGTVQANGFAAIVQDGGTCTLTLSRGAQTVTVSSPAAPDATTTSCGRMQSPVGLASGSWQAVLHYSSSTATGASQTVTVTVP